ncbi:MAG: M48 family metallopeptidase [Burkholderiales bacterium]|nr:M48 family metallopeptidase [Burkholderiales bacterium]
MFTDVPNCRPVLRVPALQQSTPRPGLRPVPTSQERLTLNSHLVKASRDCIDFVILLELCHLAEHNHSERFYRLMGQVMPQCETVKSRRDGMANVLLN